jgi:hypothetical protein
MAWSQCVRTELPRLPDAECWIWRYQEVSLAIHFSQKGIWHEAIRGQMHEWQYLFMLEQQIVLSACT